MHEDPHRHRSEELDLGRIRVAHHLVERRRDHARVRESGRPLVVLLHEEAAALELESEQVDLPAAEAAVVVLAQLLRRLSTNGRMPPAL